MRVFEGRLSTLANRVLNTFSKKVGAQYSVSLEPNNQEMLDFFENFKVFDNGHVLIRIGSENDGGYLVPDDLAGISSCYSPGVGNSWDLENQLAKSYSIFSYMLDHSVEEPRNLTSMQKFISMKLAPYSDSGQLSLEDWMKQDQEFGIENDLMLQMDIEGHEWLCLLATPASILKQFRIIVIEFHALPSASNRWILNQVYNPVIKHLLELFDIVHVHPNNYGGGIFRYLGTEFPDTVEVTFHRKDRAKKPLTLKSLPHPLDSVTVPSQPPVDLSRIFPFSNLIDL